MGKIRRKRLKISRYSPINLKESKKLNPCTTESDQGNNNTSFEIIDGLLNPIDFPEVVKTNGSSKLGVEGGLKVAHGKISSKSKEERITGLNMVAAFALESENAAMIVKQNIVLFIAPLLQDDNSQVQLAAAGALRNLCAWESDDVIDSMVQQDVLQPLSKLLKSYEIKDCISPQSYFENQKYSKGIANSTDESDQENRIFVHATNVMWSLCECNEEAIEHFNRNGLAHVLLKYIDPCVWGCEIALAAADCLFCVSENNPKVTSVILPSADRLLATLFKTLAADVSPSSLHFVIVLSGVLLNINYWNPKDVQCCKVLEVISKVLEADASSMVSSASSFPVKMTQKENLSHVISAQLIAFELLSNICCPDDEGDWEDEEESEFECYDAGSDAKMDVEESSDSNGAILPSQMIEGVRYYELVPKVQQKVVDFRIIESFQNQNDDEVKDVVQKFVQLKVRGLQCLQNLITSLPLEEFGGSSAMYAAWSTFGQMFYENVQKMGLEEQEALSGVMRAAIEKLSKDSAIVNDTKMDDLQLLLNTGCWCNNELVRANICRMVGSLAVLIFRSRGASSPEPRLALTQILDFLMKIAQDDALWVQAESLDVVIDVFSDDATDEFAAHVKLVDRLKEIAPKFKTKYNLEKKKLGDHKPLVLTVKENLTSFVKYKSQRLASKDAKN